MIGPLDSEGGLHEMVSCTTPGATDRSETGPGTAVHKMYVYEIYNQHSSPSCSVITVNSV